MPRFYQIRMRFGVGGEDLAGSVWDTDHIGIWFGSWLPEEFEKTLGLQAEERLRVLNRINDQRGVGWHFQKDGELAVVRRFYDITAEDWICTCFGGRVHIGHVSGPVERGEERFDRKRLQDTGFEMFKWRSVKKVNSFLLSELPAPYRLVPAGARGTLFQIRAYEPMMRILAVSETEKEVSRRLHHLAWDDWLGFLGPQGWEALCLGFLTIQHNFVPTGLVAGGTLEHFDMIGANWKTGERIYGQCKKNAEVLAEGPSRFLDAVGDLLGSVRIFLFAYGGCQNCPTGVTLMTGDDIKKWFEADDEGKRYRRLINGTE